MCHRKVYRVAAMITGVVLLAGMTACGARENTEGVETTVPESMVAGNQTAEDRKTTEERETEVPAETSVQQETEDVVGQEQQSTESSPETVEIGRAHV